MLLDPNKFLRVFPPGLLTIIRLFLVERPGLRFSSERFACPHFKLRKFSESKASCFLFHAIHNVGIRKSERTVGTTLLPIKTHHCQQVSSTIPKECVFLSGKVAVLPLLPLPHGLLQCIVIGLMASSQSVLQKNKVRGQDCRVGAFTFFIQIL